MGVRYLTFAALVVLTAGCGPVTSQARDGDAARIRELNDAWRAAAARRDLDGMMAIYADDARELLPGLPAIVGRDGIRAFYRGLLDTFPRFAHAFDAADVMVARSGDLAFMSGSYRFTPDTLEPDRVQTGKYVGVWRRADGDWRLLINIGNGDTPP